MSVRTHIMFVQPSHNTLCAVLDIVAIIALISGMYICFTKRKAKEWLQRYLYNTSDFVSLDKPAYRQRHSKQVSGEYTVMDYFNCASYRNKLECKIKISSETSSGDSTTNCIR